MRFSTTSRALPSREDWNKPGKLADFVIFDRNLVTCDPQEILESRALLTAVGGRLRWVDEGNQCV